MCTTYEYIFLLNLSLWLVFISPCNINKIKNCPQYTVGIFLNVYFSAFGS